MDSEYSQRFQAQQHKQHYCTIWLLHSKKRWVEPVGSLCWVIFSPLYPLVSHHLSDVKLEDTNMYYFRFMTDKDVGKWIGFTLSDSWCIIESNSRGFQRRICVWSVLPLPIYTDRASTESETEVKRPAVCLWQAVLTFNDRRSSQLKKSLCGHDRQDFFSLDKTRLISMASGDMTRLWSRARAVTGADSWAGADSLFLLRFLFWLEVREIAAVSWGLGSELACGLDGRAGSGSGPDTLQTLEDTFPPAQSSGIWEVHGAMVIGPVPEQRIKCSIVQRSHNGEPAELSGKLDKPEIPAG